MFVHVYAILKTIFVFSRNQLTNELDFNYVMMKGFLGH